MSTGEELHIPLDAPASEIGMVSAAREGEFQDRIIWARMEKHREIDGYVLRFPAGLGFDHIRIGGFVYTFRTIHAIGDTTFLIDMPNRTAIRID